jgi:ATP-dependent RNA helicase DeaD
VPSFEDLHLTPSLAAALQRLGWTTDDPIVREAIPTAARGHNLVAVTPPIPVYATPAVAGVLSRIGDGGRALVLCPASQLDEWGRLVRRLAHNSDLRVEVAQGTSRVMRQLRAEAVDVVVASPETAVTLTSRSALRMDAIQTLVLGWPESWPDADTLVPLMQDLSKETQRVIHTAQADRVDSLVERYARKALVIGTPTGEGPSPTAVRTVSVPWAQRIQALADLLELLDPATLAIWTVDRSRHDDIAQAVALTEPEVRLVTGDAPRAATIMAFDLPTAGRLQQLGGAGEVVLLVPPATESYVARIAARHRPLRLPGFTDAVTSAAAARRAAIVQAIETGKSQNALLTLAPLFERHDPAAVAAALFELWTSSAAAVTPPTEIAATSKIYVGIGKKDGVTANDLVAVLTKELRVERGKIGRIELREGYSLIEIPAQEAEQVAGALNGVMVRRKRVTARVDRGPSRPVRRDGAPRPRSDRSS